METGTDGAHKSDYLVHTATGKKDTVTVGWKDTWDCPLPSPLVSQQVLSLQEYMSHVSLCLCILCKAMRVQVAVGV